MGKGKRWVEAQEYESSYWRNVAQQIDQGSRAGLEWYRWRADQLVQRLERLGFHHLVTGNARVIEVGSGPVGLCTFFPGKELLAVDPLMESYSLRPALVEARNPNVHYLQGVGEKLPCPSRYYDLVVIENCIDHVHDPDSVMRELQRVIKPDGVLFLTVNNRSRPGYFVHRALSRLKIDRGHPFTFTPARTRALMKRSGFQVLDMEVDSYLKALWQDLASGKPKDVLKGLSGVSEYLASLIAQPDASSENLHYLLQDSWKAVREHSAEAVD